MNPRLVLNFWPSSLHLLSAGIINMNHHLGLNTRFSVSHMLGNLSTNRATFLALNVFCFVVLGIEPRASHMVGKCDVAYH